MFQKVVFVLCIVGIASAFDVKDCLQQDSISCVQLAVRINTKFGGNNNEIEKFKKKNCKRKKVKKKKKN